MPNMAMRSKSTINKKSKGEKDVNKEIIFHKDDVLEFLVIGVVFERNCGFPWYVNRSVMENRYVLHVTYVNYTAYNVKSIMYIYSWLLRNIQ